jgi:hypothetical protein
MIFHRLLEPQLAGSDLLLVFLPLTLAGFATALIFGVQRIVELFPDDDQSFQEDQSISKGANQ